MFTLPVIVFIAMVAGLRIAMRQYGDNKTIDPIKLGRFTPVNSLYSKLEDEHPVTENDVLPFAQNSLTRVMVYKLLEEYGKTNLFPDEYNNVAMAAESSLVSWLELPVQLNSCPDEIEYVKRVSFTDSEDELVHFEVFKFRKFEPHRAAQYNWMLGFAGPYFETSNTYDAPAMLFKRTDISVNMEEVAKEEYGKIVLR